MMSEFNDSTQGGDLLDTAIARINTVAGDLLAALNTAYRCDPNTLPLRACSAKYETRLSEKAERGRNGQKARISPHHATVLENLNRGKPVQQDIYIELSAKEDSKGGDPKILYTARVDFRLYQLAEWNIVHPEKIEQFQDGKLGVVLDSVIKYLAGLPGFKELSITENQLIKYVSMAVNERQAEEARRKAQLESGAKTAKLFGFDE